MVLLGIYILGLLYCVKGVRLLHVQPTTFSLGPCRTPYPLVKLGSQIFQEDCPTGKHLRCDLTWGVQDYLKESSYTLIGILGLAVQRELKSLLHYCHFLLWICCDCFSECYRGYRKHFGYNDSERQWSGRRRWRYVDIKTLELSKLPTIVKPHHWTLNGTPCAKTLKFGHLYMTTTISH